MPTKIKEQRSANTLYQEISFQDNEESEENDVVTGKKFLSFEDNFVFFFYFVFFFN